LGDAEWPHQVQLECQAQTQVIPCGFEIFRFLKYFAFQPKYFAFRGK
jgi:hypothetical protein